MRRRRPLTQEQVRIHAYEMAREGIPHCRAGDYQTARKCHMVCVMDIVNKEGFPTLKSDFGIGQKEYRRWEIGLARQIAAKCRQGDIAYTLFAINLLIEAHSYATVARWGAFTESEFRQWEQAVKDHRIALMEKHQQECEAAALLFPHSMG